MTDSMEIAREIAEAMNDGPRQPGEFDLDEYVQALREMGVPISPRGAAHQLNALVSRGKLAVRQAYCPRHKRRVNLYRKVE